MQTHIQQEEKAPPNAHSYFKTTTHLTHIYFPFHIFIVLENFEETQDSIVIIITVDEFREESVG